MGIVVGASALAENYLGLVNNVLAECGKQQVTTLASPSAETGLVMWYLNVTLEDIWTSDTNWPFAQVETTINLVSGQRAYAIPANFMRIISDPGYALGQLWYIQPDHMDLLYPDTSITGAPSSYTIYAGEFVLTPAPDSSFVADYPTLSYKYIRQPNPMVDDGDYPEVPDWLIECLKVGARAKFKEYLEAPDHLTDYQLYAALLRKGKVFKDPVRSPKGWRQFR